MKQLLLLSIVLFMSFSVVMAADTAEKKSYEVGDEVQAFTLKDAEGKEHNLADHLGEKIVVLEFWNMNCPVSRGYVERMKDLHSQFSKGDENNVVFFAIDSNAPNSVEDIKAFHKEKGMQYPVLKDEGNKIADKFGAGVTPELFIIGKDKTIQYHGAVDDSQNPENIKNHHAKNALMALVDGKEVETKETKAFGCGIKRQ